MAETMIPSAAACAPTSRRNLLKGTAVYAAGAAVTGAALAALPTDTVTALPLNASDPAVIAWERYQDIVLAWFEACRARDAIEKKIPPSIWERPTVQLSVEGLDEPISFSSKETARGLLFGRPDLLAQVIAEFDAREAERERVLGACNYWDAVEQVDDLDREMANAELAVCRARATTPIGVLRQAQLLEDYAGKGNQGSRSGSDILSRRIVEALASMAGVPVPLREGCVAENADG